MFLKGEGHGFVMLNLRKALEDEEALWKRALLDAHDLSTKSIEDDKEEEKL